MNILQYIFYFSLNSILLEVLNWFFILLSSLILLPLRIPERIYLLVVKSAQVYFLSAITALLTLRAIQDNHNTFMAIMRYVLLGLWLLYMSLGNTLYQKRRAVHSDEVLKEAIKYDVIFIIGALVLFLVVLLIPRIGFNFLTLGILDIIAKIYNLPIVGWVVGMLATVYLLYVLWTGLIISGMLFSTLLSKIKK